MNVAKCKRKTPQKLFNEIKLQMVMKIHGLSEEDAKKALSKAKRKKALRSQRVNSNEEVMSAEDFFGEFCDR